MRRELILEVDARAIAGTYGRLSRIPEEELDWWRALGFGAVWLKAPWARSPWSKQVMAHWNQYYHESIKRHESGYEVYDYTPDPAVATEQEVREFTDRLAEKGMTLIVDYVANHFAADAPALVRVDGLGIVYSKKAFLKAAKKRFPEYARGRSDRDLLRRVKGSFGEYGPACEDYKARPFYRHPTRPDSIFQHARENPGEGENIEKLIKMSLSKNIELVTNHIRNLEKSDPYGMKYPRIKSHDDLTVVCLRRT